MNNQRLSKGSEESPPREICSGDIIQFGVDVMENSRRGKVTHGCIVACIRLFLPDGSEAKTRPSVSPTPTSPLTTSCAGSISGPGGPGGVGGGAGGPHHHHPGGHPPTVVTANELFQIKHYLVEALHREQMLETKLATLQNLVTTSMEESDKGSLGGCLVLYQIRRVSRFLGNKHPDKIIVVG